MAPEITQIVEIREEKDKFLRLLELLGELYVDDDDVRSLIFVERQEKADDLLRELLRKGYGCMSLHGGKDQIDRDSTLADFKIGVCPVLIATSVAARGLDVKQLKLVVNYGRAPNHLEDYVHRAGRTGRAGNTGTAVTFITPEQGELCPRDCEGSRTERAAGSRAPHRDAQRPGEKRLRRVRPRISLASAARVSRSWTRPVKQRVSGSAKPTRPKRGGRLQGGDLQRG